MLKNITLSADEQLIEAARARAAEQRTTLNEQFRLWLEDYSRRSVQAKSAMRTIRELQKDWKTEGRKFTREEMNER